MSEKKKMGCMIFLVIIILLVVFGGGGMVLYKKYNKLEATINEKIKAIPEFNKEEIEEKIAKELNLTLPVEEPYMKKIEVQRAIKKELKDLSLKEYSTKELEERIAAIRDKYNNLPSIGDTIEFKLKNGKKVKGKYNGDVEEDNIKYIKVNKKPYKVFDIDPSYYWMFNDLIALDLLSNEVKAVRKDFFQKRQALKKSKYIDIEKKLYTANGYMRQDEKWRPVYDIFMKKYKKEKKKFENEYRQKIIDVYENNKLFGIIQIETVHDSLKNVDLKDFDLMKQIKGDSKEEKDTNPKESK